MDWKVIVKILTEDGSPEVRDSGLTTNSEDTDIAKCCGAGFGQHVTWKGEWIPCDYDRAKRWLKKIRREARLREMHEKIAKAGMNPELLSEKAVKRLSKKTVYALTETSPICHLVRNPQTNPLTIAECQNYRQSWWSSNHKCDTIVRSTINEKGAFLHRRTGGSRLFWVEPCLQQETTLESGKTYLANVFHVQKAWGRSSWDKVVRRFKTEAAAIEYIGKWIDGTADANIVDEDPRIPANQEVK